MTDKSRINLRTAIVDVLEKAHGESTLSDLLTHLRESGEVNQTAVKAIIWQLIADGEVELTPRRALRVPERYRRRFALVQP